MNTEQENSDPFANDYYANQYKAVRPEGTLDLIAEVRRILMQKGRGLLIHNYDNHPLIQEVAQKLPEVQRFNLNRFWTLQLINLPNTIEARYCLVSDGKVEDWLKLFETKVMYDILEHDLPKALP